MKRLKKIALLFTLCSAAAFGAIALFWEQCHQIDEAAAFHCENGDVVTCQETLRYREIRCLGLLRR